MDFTLPSATEANLRACVESGSALVIGTTGLEARQLKAMEKAAHEIPIVYARNMSVGVNVFMELVGRAAKALGDGYDVEIAETHHRHKVDAPSGTALALGERVAAARGRQARGARGLRAARPGRAAGAGHDRLFRGPRRQRRRRALRPVHRRGRGSGVRSRGRGPQDFRAAARCARRVGPRAGRLASTRWPTCSGSRAAKKIFARAPNSVDRRRKCGLELPPEFPRST